MATPNATTRPSWEVPHSLGSILWRAPRGAYEIRLRARPGAAQSSTYVRGDRSPSTYERAERELADRIARSSRGERVVGRRLTVGRWLETWLESIEPTVKPATFRAYRARVDLYLVPVLGHYKLADLRSDDVTRAFAKLSTMRGERTPLLSAGTIDAAYRVLNAALTAAHDAEKAPRNACRGSKHARPSTRIEPPTQAELDELLDAIDEPRVRLVLEIMRWTGARHGEVLGLDWRHVDLESGALTLWRQSTGSLKTRRSERTVFVPPHVRELLGATSGRDRVGFVFATRSGRPLDERYVLRRFDRALELVGIAPHESADLVKYRPHDLRHAFATMLLEAGVHEHVVARWLGHRGTAMLARYSHVHPMPGGDAYHRLADAWRGDLTGFGLRGRGLAVVRPGRRAPTREAIARATAALAVLGFELVDGELVELLDVAAHAAS